MSKCKEILHECAEVEWDSVIIGSGEGVEN